MSTPESEDGGILREWAPMSQFLSQVPQKMWRGIFFEDVKFTCIAADIDSIAVGTSVGVVFWYERSTHIVHQLRAEKSHQPITSITITSSVEYMVASGDKSGIVTIFRIPKDIQNSLERIERYTIDELHNSEITSLIFSTNGQKLFSGDLKGCVVLTEIDYSMSITRACSILNEKYKIVQLSFYQREQVLIVATELRSIICHNNKPQWKVVQIGQRERHNLLELGADFFIDENNQMYIYSCRGGLRLWKSDLEGNVKHTIIFKDIINSSSSPVKLLRPLKTKNDVKKSCEFGKLKFWNDGLYVAFYENNFIVLDPESVTVAATLLDAEINFTDVATTKLEIFLIFGTRNIIRLGYAPDKFNSSIGGFGNLASAEPVSSLPNFYINPIVGTPIINQETIPSRIKLSATTANTELAAGEVMYGTESALFPVVPLQDGVPELRIDASRFHLFSNIGQQDFDEIVYTNYKKKKSKKQQKADHFKRKSCPPVAMMNTDDYDDCPLENFRYSLMPDIQLYDDFSTVFKENESLLNEILPPLDILRSDEQKVTSQDTIEEQEYINDTIENQRIELVEIPLNNDEFIKTVVIQEEEQPAIITISELSNEMTSSQENQNLEPISHPVTFRDLTEGWSEMSCPEKVVWICPYNDQIIMCSPRLRSFIYKDNSWCKIPYKAQCLIINSDLAVKIHCSIAHYTDDYLMPRENWKLLSHGVDWIYVTDENTVWFVSQGEIYYLTSNTETIEKLDCHVKIQKVYSWNKILIAVTNENKIISFDGEKWHNLKSPKIGVRHLTFGPNRLAWSTDVNNKLYVSEIKLNTKPNFSWWKVDISQKEPLEVTVLNTSNDGIYISNGESASIFFNKTSVIGHKWDKSQIDIKCLQMTSEGVFEDKGCLWLLTTPNQLISVLPSLSNYEVIDVPCNVICLAASPQVLWALSDESEIYVRQQITNTNPSGENWAKINLEQFDHVTQIVHISCGCDVVWACDIRGIVFMLVASPHEIRRYSFSPAWVRVEGRAIHNNTFTKVYVGPQSHMVWALDNAGNVYVREAIFPDFLVGTGWVHVPGILASQLSISTESVRALTREGVCKRIGITQNNYIGDSWQLTSIQLEHLSVTVNECMYGIASGTNTLMTHVEKIFPISEDVYVEKDWNLL